MIAHIGKDLVDVAKLMNVEVKKVLDYRDEKSFSLFLSAYNKDKIEFLNFAPLCTVNSSFKKNCDELRDKIFAEANNDVQTKYRDLSHWISEANNVWNSINKFDSILVLKDLREISDRNKLQKLSN
mmetsp:Transcript_48079/g.35278  ORF Transcript_48079/g.35278 Transcript_48079/m.35278 type:complete len:126 (+) Transcript_48079:674-1051(+)